LMIYMGGFISTASHGQTFLSPPAKPGVYLFDYYVSIMTIADEKMGKTRGRYWNPETQQVITVWKEI